MISDEAKKLVIDRQKSPILLSEVPQLNAKEAATIDHNDYKQETANVFGARAKINRLRDESTDVLTTMYFRENVQVC